MRSFVRSKLTTADLRDQTTVQPVKQLVLVMILSFFLGSTGAAQETKLYRIVILSVGQAVNEPDNLLIVAFLEGLRKAGYTDGKNLHAFIPDIAVTDQLSKVIHDHKAKTDLFITIGSTETAIAQQLVSKIPIVFMPAVDPRRAGFVNSLAQPGTNLTGLAYDVGYEMRGKQLEILNELAPHARRILVMYDANVKNPIQSDSIKLLHKVAARLGLILIEKPIKRLAEIEERTLMQNVEGIFILCTNLFSRDQKTPAIAIKKKLPLHGCPTQTRKFGALVSYGPDLSYLGRRGAWYVDQILKGADPRHLPVETPNQFELLINLKTVAALELTVPPEVLQRADKIIR